VHIFCTIDVMAYPNPYNHVTIYGISQLIENRSIIILLIEEGLYVTKSIATITRSNRNIIRNNHNHVVVII